MSPEKDFYSHLNMEDITDAGYTHAKRVLNKTYRRIGRFLCSKQYICDVFENFWIMCLEIYKLDPACFLAAQKLAYQGALKKTKPKLDLVTNIDMLLTVETKAISTLFIDKRKLITNTWTKIDENKEQPDLKYCHVNNLCGEGTSQKLLIADFKQVGETSPFNENFIKSYIMMIVMKNIFLKFRFNILETYNTFTVIYPF